MARKKTDIEMAKAIAIKRLRNRVRLELSVMADRIINDLVDEFTSEFDERVAAGDPYEVENYDEWVTTRISGYVG